MCQNIYYILSLISITTLVFLTSYVSTQPDLCRNPKIDSIEWIESQKQYFFTSGGYWWLIKENEMPPPVAKAHPLKHGFKKGESAVLKDTMKECGKSRYRQVAEQELVVSELMPDGRHMLMIFDLRDKDWKTPIQFNQDKAFSTMTLDWTKSVDAMFSYKTFEIYGIQGTRYTGGNFTKLCKNSNDFSDVISSGNITVFATLSKIDAMFTKPAPQGNIDLYMFIEDDFYVYNIDSKSSGGKFFGHKQQVKSIAKEFFRYTGECGAAPPPKPVITEGPQPTLGSASQTSQTEAEIADPTEENKKGGTLWIIIGVILLIIVIAVIAVLAFIFMRKKKRGETEYEKGSGSKVGSRASGSQVGSRTGSQVGSRAASKSASRTPSASASRAALGTSPSKVSQRSTMSSKSKASTASKT